MDEGFDVQEEDFKFFDDEPSSETDPAETSVSEVHPAEGQVVPVREETSSQPMENVKMGMSSPNATLLEPQMILSPPYSPLRILPSPPPARRGTFPKIWDQVRLSGNLEKIQKKYRKGGKYWCDDLGEGSAMDDSPSSSDSEDEGIELSSTNLRKRKRDDDDEDIGNHGLRASSLGTQSLDSDVIAALIRAIDDNLLLLQSPRDDLLKLVFRTDEKYVDYANGLDLNGFNALVDTVADQVSWDGLGLSDAPPDQQILPIDDFHSVIESIWGVDTTNNLGLKEFTEVTDIISSFDEEDSPQQLKTPRMKAVKSSTHNQHSSTFSLISNIEQTQSIYPIPSPSFLVHRVINRNHPAPNHVQQLSVAPPALRFWEKFSFSPVSKEKNVSCYVVHPDSEGMVSAVETFLSEIQTTWESCGMGKFERGKVIEGGKEGMIPISVSCGANDEVYFAAYQDGLVNSGITAFKILLISGRGLSTLQNTWLKNILVLIVNPFMNVSAIIPLCRAFLNFKSTYFEGTDSPALIPECNVALQIVPVGMVAKKEGIVVRGLEFQAFLRGLYDRCEATENSNANSAKPAVPLSKMLLILVLDARVSYVSCHLNYATPTNYSRI
jgi:hypothetical protein